MTQGDPFAIELLACEPWLRKCAYRFVRVSADADDLVQSTLFRAWHKRDNFTPGTNLRAWCATILKNIFLDERRQSWRSIDLSDDIMATLLAAEPGNDVLQELDEVRRSIFTLPPLLKEAILLVCVLGLKYSEVAMLLNCPIGTVKSRVSKGRAALEDCRLTIRLRDEIKPSCAMASILGTAFQSLEAANGHSV